MATTTTKSKVAKSPSTTTKKTTINTEKTEIPPITETVTKKQEYRVKKNLDPNMIITVRNGFQGKLVYVSQRTKERFVWDSFGDEQDMDLQELKNAKNASKAFFENNWFLIDDPEIIEYLGVTQYYKYALNFDSFNDLFASSPEEIKEIVSRLSTGQKKSVAYRAKQLIADEIIDSIKVISALEESLSIELIER